jgi:hypothetical protein
MMRIKKLFALVLVCCSVMLVNPVKAQTDCVKVKFEVDGKDVNQKFKIILYVNNEVIEPPVSANGFTVPPEIKSSEKVNVRFLSGEYDLLFESVYVPKFKTDWTIGIDKPPFDKENIASENPDPPNKELLIIYYIDFVPKNKGDGTRMVVKVYK